LKRDDLRAIVANVFEIEAEELVSDTDLTALPMYDSVLVLTLMVELSDRAGVLLSPSDIQKIRYYRDIEQIAASQNIELTD
jgi:acyl carrier protein